VTVRPAMLSLQQPVTHLWTEAAACLGPTRGASAAMEAHTELAVRSVEPDFVDLNDGAYMLPSSLTFFTEVCYRAW
jgi:hypothetical protein